MLRLAVEAQLPLLAVTTRDVMNLHEVLHVITKKQPITWQPAVPFEMHKLYTFTGHPKTELPYLELYQKLVKAESTLIVVNPATIKEPMFNAGDVPVPRALLKSMMDTVVGDDKKASALLRGLGGVTVKEAAELSRLTMARDNSLTVDGLMETRRSSFVGANGLTPVDTKQGFYAPPEQLQEWVKVERRFFLEETDPRLIPRGLLFDGPPGTGKTSGAKWLAEQIGVPLYRMDIGGTKSKWVGESEGKLMANLSRIDNEAPAVVLLDEVEKIFSKDHSDTSGTTTSMLSQLLWWLAERRSRILVVMTTNKASALPPELYREGRIDQVMWMSGLNESGALNFAEILLGTFKSYEKKIAKIGFHKVAQQIIKSAPTIPGTSPQVWAQAALTKATYTTIKTLE